MRWTWTLDLLMRGLSDLTAGTEEAQATGDRSSTRTTMPSPPLLGRRLGEMHAVLARATDDPAFAPETADGDDRRAMGGAGGAAAGRAAFAALDWQQ